MDTNLPEPMTPKDCDLRGYDFMPLYGNRLFNSHLYRKAIRNPRAGLAAFKLWWVAWLECPAGSLPDDDEDLASLADFGLDTEAWLQVRELALHGFVKCSDGRLYHPILAEFAIEAFDRRKRERERKAIARAKKSGQAQDTSGHSADVSQGRPTDVPRDNPGTVPGQAVDVPSDRTGQDRTGTGQKKEKAQRTRTTIPKPTLNDDPPAWFGLADKTEVDRDGVERPVVGGSYLDIIAFKVCELAEMNGHSKPLDWQPLVSWLRDDIDPETQIYPAIKRIATRRGYAPPRFLSYFDNAVRAERAA